MKKVIVNIKRVEYGWVEVEVPDNATDEEIREAAYEAEADGMCNWGNYDTEVTKIVEEKIEED